MKLDKASGQPVKAGAPAAQEQPELLRHTMRPISFDGDRCVRVMMDAAGGLFVSLRDAGDVLGDDRHLLLKTAFKQDGLRFADAGGRAPHAFVPAMACVDAMLGRQRVDADFRVKVADWVGAVSAAFPEAAVFGIGVYTPAGREASPCQPGPHPVGSSAGSSAQCVPPAAPVAPAPVYIADFSKPDFGMPPAPAPVVAAAAAPVPASPARARRRSMPTCTKSQTDACSGARAVAAPAAPVVAAPAAAQKADALAVLGDGPLTMSTREIAELTGKRHDNVLADTRKMLEELGKAAPEFSGAARIAGPNGSTRTVEVFNLPKDLTFTLVAGYSVQMRHRIVTRWMELEAEKAAAKPAPAAPAPETREQILARALLLSNDVIREKDELIGQQAEVISVLEPKAAALDRITDSEGTRCITDAAAELGVARGVLIEHLISHRWLYRRYEKGPLCCYAEALAAKVVAMVETEGGGKTRPQARITAYGLTRLAILLPKWLAGERPPMPKAPPSPQGSLLH